MMAKGPGLYSEIGKKVKDLLNKDYQSDQKFTVTTRSSTGVSIAASGIKKGEILSADISAKLKNKNIVSDIKVDTKSNLHLTTTVEEPAPGLKLIFTFTAPDKKSGKAEVQYVHEYTGVSTSIGLTANPIVNFSGVLGTNALAFGTDLSFDVASGNFTKGDAAIGFSHSDLTASLKLGDKGDELSATYYHTVSPLTATAVGAEVSHRFSTKANTISIGTQHSLDPLTKVKAKVNSNGIASALVQHKWKANSLITISGEVDVKAIDSSAKVGLALALDL